MDVVYTGHMYLEVSGYNGNDDDKRYESKNKLFSSLELYYIADVVIRTYQ